MIKVKKLSKNFPGGINALSDVSFEIHKGQICGYIGTNGAGKSTTVKILTGMLEYEAGEVFVNEISVKDNPVEVKKIIGYVPETANLFNSLTAREFLEFIGTVRNLNKEVFEKRLNNFSQLFEYGEMLDESLGNLSKGNKQKILITSAMLHNPEVLFLDEPLNGLDANAIFVFHDLLRYLITKGKTILYCSHLLNTIEQISSKIILIDKGKIMLDSETGLLKNSENYSGLEDLFKKLNNEKDKTAFRYENLFA